MKKILLLTITAVAAATLSSCSKSNDFSGSDGDVSYQMGPYMMCIANDLVIDNLKVLEYNINQAETKSASLDPSFRLPGVKVEKAAEDSTWIISNKNLDFGMLDVYYPTDYTIKARMLPGTNKTYHDWKVSIEGSRQEKDGYGCKFGTDKDGLTYLVGEAEYSWGSCIGNLNMIVYENGEPIDSIVMILRGDRYDYSLRRTY